jgi:gluconolactonase
MIFDDQWRLIACESGERPRVTRTDLKTGKIEVLAEGDFIKRPNDVSIDSKGRIYFTEVLGKSIYRIDPDGKITQIATAPEIQMPNGIVISADDRKLYMVESAYGPTAARLIRAFDLAENGTVSNMKVLYTFEGSRGADSISIDSMGNVYAAGGLNREKGSSEIPLTRAGVYVISPEGELLKFYPIWEDRVTNCAFGGPDMKTLYVTAGKSLLSIKVDIPGTRR